MAERQKDARGATIWGNPVPVARPIPAHIRRANLEDYDRRVALLDELGELEVRIITAFHFFGTAGLPEGAKSAALRRSDPDKWWKLVDLFVRLCRDWDAKMCEAAALRMRHEPDPPDLYRLVSPYLDDDPDPAVY